MDVYALDSIGSVRNLVGYAQESDEPLVVFDGDDECLVAMRPSVFEHILYDVDQLNYARGGSAAYGLKII